MNLNEDIIFLEKQFANGNLSTPKIIDSDVTSFCKNLGNANKPYYLNTEPFHWSRVNCCDLNVKKIVKEQGGEIIFGFKIWSIPKLYIEASLHSIWENPNGKLIDITPNEDGEKTVLFLPEPRLNTVRLKREGEKPRFALKETLIEYVNLLIKQQLTIGCMYPSDEDIWKNNISYKRLRKKLNKKRR